MAKEIEEKHVALDASTNNIKLIKFYCQMI
jgi:hypothetical protein